MRFYSSANLKQWEYMSEFGEGFGPQPFMPEKSRFQKALSMRFYGQEETGRAVNFVSSIIL